MPFTHLHCHSHFSLLDGLSKIDPLVSRAQELGMAALALTDHGAMYGAIEFYNRCREAGIKPLVGVEAYVAPRSLADKEPKIDSDYFHLTLLAQNITGYKNLLKLTSIAHLQGFYYKPRIDLEILKTHGEGLICLSGCQRGEIARAAAGKTEAEAQKVLEKYLDIFGRGRLFMEVQRNSKYENAEEKLLNDKLVRLARHNNLKLVATADSHYIYPEDSQAHDVLICIGTGRTVNDAERLDMRGYDLSLKSEQKMQELFYDLPEALSNTQIVADMCELEIPLDQRYFPKVQIPGGLSSEEYLRKIVAQKSLPLYGSGGVVPPHITERINYELDIICKKGFDTYFLMVADIVDGARNIGAITNTRGSAAGSIVGKILGITNVDPLYYELPFERFLTMQRPTPPDIDLDIADNRRDEAIEYITRQYGADKVAQIITFGTMQARAAVRDVGRASGVPYSKCDQIAKMIPIGKQGFHMTLDKALDMNLELKEIYQRDPETKQILDIAKKLEGGARHASVHAAGIVITPTELVDYTPLQKEPEGNRVITQYDMRALDVNVNGSKAIGLVKMDLLGIRNLSILEQAVKIAEKRHNVKVDIYNLPQPDPKTFEMLGRGLTFGVFQMGSSGMTRYLKELKPSSIFDVMAMIALYRPGPMQFIPEYIARKHNPKLIKYLDSSLEKILYRTYGILVYQDDLLTIAHDLAGYSWEEVDKFRKAVGKKNPEEMAKQKIKFIDGCMKTSGWSQAKAAEVWAWIEPFAAYGFNKSHSASYAVVSYQTAYMKANFPVEFMAALMSAEAGDETKIYAAVEECKNLGISVLPPDVNESRDNFTVVDDKTIRFGLNAIKNLGSDVIGKIITGRREAGEFSALQDFLLRINTKNLNKKSWEALVKGGALDRFGERGMLLYNTEHILEYVREQARDGSSSQTSLFGPSLQIGKLVLKDAPAAGKDQKMAWEKEHLGLYVTAHPLGNYKKVLANFKNIGSLHLDDLGTQQTLGGIIAKLKRTLTKKNDPMAFFTLEDRTGHIEVLVFPKLMEKALAFLQTDRVVEVTGRISDREEDLKLIADDIRDLPNDEVYEMALAEMEKGKNLVLHMQSLANMGALNRIKEILSQNPGQAQVYLSVGAGATAKKIKTQSQIRISQELIRTLRAIPEIGMVNVE